MENITNNILYIYNSAILQVYLIYLNEEELRLRAHGNFMYKEPSIKSSYSRFVDVTKPKSRRNAVHRSLR